jgi:hypothetical protein
MCGPGRGEPHRNLVDSVFQQLARGALSVHGQLRTNDFDEVGAAERRLVDLLGRSQDARAAVGGARCGSSQLDCPLLSSRREPTLLGM